MLTGTWIPQGAEFEGKSLPLPRTCWRIDGERYVMEGEESRDEGYLRIDASVIPHRVDIVGTRGPNAGRTIPAIFRQRGNLLQICYRVGDAALLQPRPVELATGAGMMQILVRYRRKDGADR